MALLAPALLTAMLGAADVSTPGTGLRGDTFIHDPSTILRQDDRFYLAGTGIGLRLLSSSNLMDWTREQPIFASPPSWTTNAVPGFRGHFWAPDLLRVGDRYLLYYSVSTFGQQVSAIGLASTPTLHPGSPGFQWTDHGPVIQSMAGSPFNAIDPAVIQDADGKLWMVFGSFWKGIYLTPLDPDTGLRLSPDAPPQRLAWHQTIEAPSLLRHGAYYYLFVNWGWCCRGTNSTYEIRVGRSQRITGPYLDAEGQDMIDRGGTLFLESSSGQIGPGHFSAAPAKEAGLFSYHYYDPAARGRSRLALGKIAWSEDGWPQAIRAPGQP